MPRIAGVNVLGGFLAAIAIYFVGFIWFGVLFQDLWMTSSGFTEEMLTESFNPAITFGGGFLIPLILAFALGWLLKATGTSGLVPSILFGLKIGLFVAAPLLAYGFVYNVIHSTTGLLLDVSHSVVGLMLGAAVLSFFE